MFNPTVAQTVTENVIFDKISEVSITRATWTITFILDLTSYDGLFQSCNEYLNDISTVVHNALLHQGGTSSSPTLTPGRYQKPILAIHEELAELNATRDRFYSTYIRYKAIHSRQKRSLIPVIGDLGNWLFGLSTDSDLQKIRGAVDTLGENQEKLTHIISESLTVINKTYSDVSTNRKRLKRLNAGMKDVYKNLRDFEKETLDNFSSLTQFISIYVQLKDLVDMGQQVVFETITYFNHLKNNLDMLTAGQITPSTVLPNDLQQVLIDIESSLPNSLRLPADPKRIYGRFIKLCVPQQF